MRLVVTFITCILIITQSHVAYAPLPDTKPNARSQEESFVEANNAFAIHLYKHLSSTDGNIFFCPACLSASLTMLMDASVGETSMEFNKTLQFRRMSLNSQDVRLSYAMLTERMKISRCLAHFTSTLFAQKGYELKPEFMEDAEAIYNTEIAETDFADNPQQAVWDVNESIKTGTQGRIKRLFERMDSKNSMLLVNAANFKTKFVKLFDSDISLRQKFYNQGFRDHEIEVFVMERIGAIQRIADSYDFRALELPCGEGNVTAIKLWIFLPHKMGTLSDVEYGLSTATFRHIRDSFKHLAINITIPRIRFDFSRDISKDLQKLGIQKAFGVDADFSSMSEMKGLSLSQVLQRAIVDINEDGYESFYTNYSNSSADGDVRTQAYIPPFKANHPFLFCVMDSYTGLILYLGRVFEF